MGIFNRNLRVSAPEQNFQTKKYSSRTAFNGKIEDSFQYSSPAKLCSEQEIRKMIAQNPEIERILAKNNLPLELNMDELKNVMSEHARETVEISSAIAKNLPASLKQYVDIKSLKEGALLHDFGKVLIPREILNKPGSLSPEEYRIMGLHTELGYELLKNSGLSEESLKLVRYHHLKELPPDINLQILNLADRYSALTEKRVYKDAYSNQKALMVLYSDVKNGNINPLIFNALVQSISYQPPQINSSKQL
ncbi:HD domain-containing protein [bacterium]|nr:HD domain-containing protein [bacterium]